MFPILTGLNRSLVVLSRRTHFRTLLFQVSKLLVRQLIAACSSDCLSQEFGQLLSTKRQGGTRVLLELSFSYARDSYVAVPYVYNTARYFPVSREGQPRLIRHVKAVRVELLEHYLRRQFPLEL